MQGPCCLWVPLFNLQPRYLFFHFGCLVDIGSTGWRMARGVNILSLGNFEFAQKNSTEQQRWPEQRWRWRSWFVRPLGFGSRYGEDSRYESLGADTTTLRLFWFDWRHKYRRVTAANIQRRKTGELVESRIIAIMLGRLSMSVDECIRSYKMMAEKAFTPKSGIRFPVSPSGAFSATALVDAIKMVIKENCQEEDCKRNECQHADLEFRNHTCCKT